MSLEIKNQYRDIIEAFELEERRLKAILKDGENNG